MCWRGKGFRLHISVVLRVFENEGVVFSLGTFSVNVTAVRSSIATLKHPTIHKLHGEALTIHRIDHQLSVSQWRIQRIIPSVIKTERSGKSDCSFGSLTPDIITG